jgi:hypothetical protein
MAFKFIMKEQMIHTRVYKTTVLPVKKTGTLKVSRGIDWMLEDNGIKSISYSILEQVVDFTAFDASGKMIVKMRPRPTDWVGSLYFDTTEQEIEIVKQDSKAVWVRQKGLEYVHWYADVDPGIVEAWKRL